MTNTATASGTDQYGLAVTSNQSRRPCRPSGTTSSLSLTKTATVSGYSAAGQTLTYSYLVTNTGTTTINSIAVTDNKVAPADSPARSPRWPRGLGDLHRNVRDDSRPTSIPAR